MNIVVEPMEKPRDIADVFALLGILHQEQAELFVMNGMDISLPGFDLEDYNVDMIRVEDETKAVTAGVILTKQSHCFEDTYTISDIVLYKDYRGRGIGRKALDRILSMMAADGVRNVNLNVHADNKRALRLYESLGFKPTSLHMSRSL